jgi:hypothetical protein
VGDGLAHRKEELEEFVRHSLDSAEQLARASRLAQRPLSAPSD